MHGGEVGDHRQALQCGSTSKLVAGLVAAPCTAAIVGMGVGDSGKIVAVGQSSAKVVEVDPVSGAQTVLASAPSSTFLLGLAVARNEILPDSDGDGLPDWWEQHYFPYVGAQPGSDADGDGMSNLSEYKAGTSPLDPQSALKLVVKPLESGLTLEWGSVQKRQYTLERSSVLSSEPGAFAPFLIGIKAAPPTNSVLLLDAGTEGNYFYRLRLEE